MDIRKESKTPKIFDTVEGKNGLAALKDMATRVKALCSDPSDAALSRFVEEMVMTEDLTCKITMYRPFELNFKRSTANSRLWVSNEGPTGECGVVNVVSLEQEKDHPTLWTYTSRRTVTNKAGGGIMKCDAWDERPLVFSWKADEKMRRCNSIKFGL